MSHRLNPNDYDVLSVLGEGSFGRALKCTAKPWCAAIPPQHETFVIKEIQGTYPGDIEEAKLLRACNHNNIVQYLASFKRAGSLHIAMEYCDCGTLTEFVTTMNKEEFCVWRTLAHFTSAIEYLHSKRPPIMHRDIKPDNILGKTSGYALDGSSLITWKLADFGIAKLLNKKRLESYYAQTFAGTEIYMAPEVMDTRVDVNNRYGLSADIWSVGAVMHFYCSNGKHLFKSDMAVWNWKGGYSRRLNQSQQQYSKGLHSLVSGMLDPDPEERPSASQVLLETRKFHRTRDPSGLC